MKIMMISHEYLSVGDGSANTCIHLTKSYATGSHQVILVTI